MQNDSDKKDSSHPPVHRHPSGSESIHSAGRLHSAVAGYTKWNKAMADNPCSPFLSESDFNLASWFVWSHVAKSQIDAYLAEDLGGTDSRSFQFAYTLRHHLDILDPFREYLVWVEASINDG